jgi:hypothetical protein
VACPCTPLLHFVAKERVVKGPMPNICSMRQNEELVSLLQPAFLLFRSWDDIAAASARSGAREGIGNVARSVPWRAQIIVHP